MSYRDYHTGELIDGPRVQVGNVNGEMVISVQAEDRHKFLTDGKQEYSFADLNSFMEWLIKREQQAPWIEHA